MILKDMLRLRLHYEMKEKTYTSNYYSHFDIDVRLIHNLLHP